MWHTALRGATFKRGCSLHSADFKGADFKGAIFEGVSLVHAIFHDDTILGVRMLTYADVC